MTNNHGFIVVLIQYRLGAFGFLSSAELSRFGIPNAGLYDMEYSLKWVQENIHLFGGNASRVTISGESAGAGGVMLQAVGLFFSSACRISCEVSTVVFRSADSKILDGTQW
jgi:carboxylesterase type B